jgi:hypothetical protein
LNSVDLRVEGLNPNQSAVGQNQPVLGPNQRQRALGQRPRHAVDVATDRRHSMGHFLRRHFCRLVVGDQSDFRHLVNRGFAVVHFDCCFLVGEVCRIPN